MEVSQVTDLYIYLCEQLGSFNALV